MIKLRQINHSTLCVTRDTPDGSPQIMKQYSLIDIWVNPKAVLYLQTDEALTTENKKAPLIDGLNSKHTFTRLFISENGFARQLSVVGEPEVINKEIEGSISHA